MTYKLLKKVSKWLMNSFRTCDILKIDLANVSWKSACAPKQNASLQVLDF